MLRLAARLLLRDWRAGELRVLAAALVVAVASVSSVGFFTDRVRAGMDRQASELLGGDLVLDAGAPIGSAIVAQARALGLRTAGTTSFRSVVLSGQTTQLVEVKAVGPHYPLEGRLKIGASAYGAARPTSAIPARGTVWVAPRLLALLHLEVGGRLALGAESLTIAHVLAYEPDRGGDLFNIAPRVLMNGADLPATGLVQPGSRVRYRLLVAGPTAAVKSFKRWVTPRLQPGERLLGVKDGRPELRFALERAHQFLGLAALVSVVLAGVAVATATRRYVRRHLDSSAVMRCLGATQRTITALFVLTLLGLGVLAGAAGCVVGYAAQAGLEALLGPLLLGELPAPGLSPAAFGMATGLITLLGFALPTLLMLREVPPVRVLRRDLGPLPPRGWLVYTASAAAVAVLMVWQVGDGRLAAYLLGGIALTFGLLGAGAAALVWMLGGVRRRVGVAWRFGLANVVRRARGSVAQIVAFGLAIMVLLLLSVVRVDLLQSWRQSLPADAPNHFLINIQSDQLPAIKAFFADHGLAAPTLYPMVRGRLVAIDGRQVGPGDYQNPRAKRLIDRDFNLSWATRLQTGNRIAAGHWWTTDDSGKAWVSMEQGIARTLGVKLGDRLTYRVAGRDLQVTVTSLRSVNWDTFRVNFFAVVPPGVLNGYPTTWVTSFHLPSGREPVLAALVKSFPNVTDIDVAAVMQRVRGIIERVALGVQYVFGFTLAAGVVVLLAAIQSSQDERRQECAVLKTLGARHRQLQKGLIAEFMTLGWLSGLLGGLGATLAGWLLASQVFHIDYQVDWRVWVLGMVCGGFGVALAGLLGTRRVLAERPLATLRQS